MASQADNACVGEHGRVVGCGATDRGEARPEVGRGGMENGMASSVLDMDDKRRHVV